VRALVNHVVEGTLVVELMLDGRDGAEVQQEFAGDLLGDDPRAAFTAAATRASTALGRPGAADVSVRLGPDTFPGAFFAHANLGDVLIHAWDLAVATNGDTRLPEDLVAAVTAFFDDMEDFYREAGLIGDPVPVARDADAQTRLLARLGRSAHAPVPG
jgi:uncharacterized protein (TIGR03086 family)